MVKQAIKKKEGIKKSSIADIKAKLGLNTEGKTDLIKSSADKPLDWILLPKAYQDAVKLPGIPAGFMSIITGWSNTGKSTIKNCIIASCIRQGILPVIIETESNFDWSYAIDCGVQATPIYGDVEVEKVDEETGEVYVETENRIIDYTGDFLYYDSTILAEMYGANDYSTGKQTSKKRKVAVIEDIAYCINEILDMQDNGDIQQPLCFIWDSVGSIGSYKSYTSKAGNNMFDANAISVAFNTILNNRIPQSRKIGSQYTNTFICVNKIWNDSMNSMGGAASIELKGGRSFFYSARLILHLGGIAKASVKKLTATAKGSNYNYGIITKIKINKNQLPTPYNLTYEGEMACVHCGLWPVDEIDLYKKTHLKDIIKKIEANMDEPSDVQESDIQFSVDEDEVEM